MGRDAAVIGHDVEVAIVSYRTPQLALACADSIDTGALRSHVTVMDTSEQAHFPRLATPRRRAQSWVHAPGLGYAAALERVLGASESPWLIACNADVEFPAESIEPLIELFAEHPRLALIGPRQVSPSLGLIVHGGIAERGSPNGGRAFGEPDVGQLTETLTPIAQVSGSVMLMRREAYREVGGMTGMPHLYFEDALLCRRLWLAGWEVAYSGLQTFVHHVAASPMPTPDRAVLAREAAAAWARETAA